MLEFILFSHNHLAWQFVQTQQSTQLLFASMNGARVYARSHQAQKEFSAARTFVEDCKQRGIAIKDVSEPVLRRHVARQFMQGNDLLAPLTANSQSIDATLAYLDLMGDQSTDQPMQQALQSLATYLDEQQLFSRDRQRLALAKAMQDNQWQGQNIIWAPDHLPALEYLDILKYLSADNNVQVVLTGNVELLADSLNKLGFADNVRIHQEEVVVNSIFVKTDHALETAIDQALKLYEQDQVVDLVVPSVKTYMHQIADEASRRNLPVRLKFTWQTTDLPVGSLLLALSKRDSAVEIAQVYEMPEEKISECYQTTGQEFFQSMFSLGEYFLLTQEDSAQGSWPWLQAYQDQLARCLAKDIWPNATELVQDVVTAAVEVGDEHGVGVVSYQDVMALQQDACIFLGFEQMSFEIPSSALMSPQTAQKFDFVHPFSVLDSGINCGRTQVFVIEDPENVAVQRLMQQKSATELQTSTTASRRRTLRQLARNKQLPDHYEYLMQRSVRHRLQNVVVPEKTSFSVTELEQYLSCPYGWFVGYMLKPKRELNQAAVIGVVQHSILAELVKQGIPEALWEQFVDEKLSEYVEADELSVVTAAASKARLLRVMHRYSPSRWATIETHIETDLEYQLDANTTLTGRADRIDCTENGLIVVDYKNRRSPKKNMSRQSKELQRYLYPLMAAEKYQLAAGGMVYVSLFHGAHEGSLTGYVAGLSGPTVDHQWMQGCEQAQALAQQAIADIRRGDWSRVGQSCPSFCPHHLISETVDA